jgi:hypothetical protein
MFFGWLAYRVVWAYALLEGGLRCSNFYSIASQPFADSLRLNTKHTTNFSGSKMLNLVKLCQNVLIRLWAEICFPFHKRNLLLVAVGSLAEGEWMLRTNRRQEESYQIPSWLFQFADRIVN